MTNRTSLDVRTPDGVADCVAFRPDGPGPLPAVIFFFDAGGLRPAMEEMAARIASQGCFVLLPNLHYRKQALDAAGVRYQIELYPGALHGFAVPDFTMYDAAAAERHWQRVLASFEAKLPPTA